MANHSLFLVGVLCLFIGFLFLGLASASYEWRAFRNKRAWNGPTKPLLLIGLFFFIVAVIAIYVFYPFD